MVDPLYKSLNEIQQSTFGFFWIYIEKTQWNPLIEIIGIDSRAFNCIEEKLENYEKMPNVFQETFANHVLFSRDQVKAQK